MAQRWLDLHAEGTALGARGQPWRAVRAFFRLAGTLFDGGPGGGAAAATDSATSTCWRSSRRPRSHERWRARHAHRSAVPHIRPIEIVRSPARSPPPAEVRRLRDLGKFRPPGHHAAPDAGNEFRAVSAAVPSCDLDPLVGLMAACGAFERRGRHWHTAIIFSIASSERSSADPKTWRRR
jgi:hypothetical protein